MCRMSNVSRIYTIERAPCYMLFKFNVCLLQKIKEPRVRGSGSVVLRIPEFESQKFLKLVEIPAFNFLKFSYFETCIFLKFYTKNILRTIILDF